MLGVAPPSPPEAAPPPSVPVEPDPLDVALEEELPEEELSEDVAADDGPLEVAPEEDVSPDEDAPPTMGCSRRARRTRTLPSGRSWHPALCPRLATVAIHDTRRRPKRAKSTRISWLRPDSSGTGNAPASRGPGGIGPVPPCSLSSGARWLTTTCDFGEKSGDQRTCHPTKRGRSSLPGAAVQVLHWPTRRSWRPRNLG